MLLQIKHNLACFHQIGVRNAKVVVSFAVYLNFIDKLSVIIRADNLYFQLLIVI